MNKYEQLKSDNNNFNSTYKLLTKKNYYFHVVQSECFLQKLEIFTLKNKLFWPIWKISPENDKVNKTLKNKINFPKNSKIFSKGISN